MTNSVFVYRMGPVDFGEGPALYFYATLPHSDPLVAESDDTRALAQLVDRFPDAELWCEPPLAAAGGPLGFKSRELTDGEASQAAIVWLTCAFHDWYKGIKDVDAKSLLVVDSGNLYAHRRGKRSILELRLHLDGFERYPLGGELYAVVLGDLGMAIFRFANDMAAFQQLVRSGDVAAGRVIPRLHLRWKRGPERQQEIMRMAFNTELTPIPTQDDEKGEHNVDDHGAWVIEAAVASVLAWINARRASFAGELDLFVGKAQTEVELLRAYGEDASGQVIEMGWDELVAYEAKQA